ncbi:MAG: hypothetical protein IJ644_03030 [Oscillospiraceae bacterium]|nr:hypothetical protein [Oscillospiraceae bacterium]
MEYTRMSTKDMLQYCDEALAWEEFGPVDVFFFESVKRILLGQCSAVEMPEEPEEPDELAEVTVPIPAEEMLIYEQASEQLEEAIKGETFFESGSSDYVIESESESEETEQTSDADADGKEEA